MISKFFFVTYLLGMLKGQTQDTYIVKRCLIFTMLFLNNDNIL